MAELVKVNLEPMKRFAKAAAEGIRNGGNDKGPIGSAFSQWAFHYRGFLRERFVNFSRGGGDWKPLVLSTILRRRAKGGGTRRQKLAKARATIVRASATKANADERIKKFAPRGHAEKVRKARLQIDRANVRIEKAKEIVRTTPTMAGISILWDTGTLLNALDPTFSVKSAGRFTQGIPSGIRVGYGGPDRHPKGKATIADIASFHQEGAGHLPARKIIVAPPPSVTDAMAADMRRAIKQLPGAS